MNSCSFVELIKYDRKTYLFNNTIQSLCTHMCRPLDASKNNHAYATHEKISTQFCHFWCKFESQLFDYWLFSAVSHSFCLKCFAENLPKTVTIYSNISFLLQTAISQVSLLQLLVSCGRKFRDWTSFLRFPTNVFDVSIISAGLRQCF